MCQRPLRALSYQHLRLALTHLSFSAWAASRRFQDEFFTAYRAYLKTQVGHLRAVLDAVREKTCCLMCLERHAMDCHRSAVSDMLKQLDGNGLRITHL